MLCPQWNLATGDKLGTLVASGNLCQKKAWLHKVDTHGKKKQLTGKSFVILVVLLNDTTKEL